MLKWLILHNIEHCYNVYMNDNFQKILNAYIDLNEILLADHIEKFETHIYIQSKIKSPYYSITIPLTEKVELFDIKSIEKNYSESGNKSSIYLLETQQLSGFTEFLIKSGYTFDGRDTWMLFDKTNKNAAIPVKPVEITKETFTDFYNVLDVVFSDFDGNDSYQSVIKNSLGSVLNTLHPDLVSRVFVIYENSTPVSGGALLYSKSGNFAYLHDTGTLEEYRGKGYQTSLIRHRVEIATKEGIENIFSLVEHGGQSWRNMIKNGFKQKHVANLFVKELV